MNMSKPEMDVVVEYVHRQEGGQFWLDLRVDGKVGSSLGPFDTAAERQVVHEDILEMMRSVGAKDMPVMPQ